MSLFQSALDFLAGPGSSGAASRDQNDFVGQVVELGDMKLRIKRVIAEGEAVAWPWEVLLAATGLAALTSPAG